MKLVIFDCDGVLLNTEELIHEAQQKTFADFGINYSAKEMHHHFVGLSYQDFIQKCQDEFKTHTGEDLPADFNARIHTNYKALETEKLKVIEGMRELIAALKAIGTPFCVASNTNLAHLKEKLRFTGLHTLFDPHIFSREHVGKGKPAPDIFLFSAKEMGFDPSECIVVEDSPAGVIAGFRAGMHVIGFARNDQDLPTDPGKLMKAGASETVLNARELHTRIFTLLGKNNPIPQQTTPYKPPHP